VVEGYVAVGFEPVRDAFADVVREQGGAGAAAAVWYDGRWVVDLVSGGWAPDSRAMYWPEFTAAATLRQVLSHQSGIVGLDAPAPTDRVLVRIVAQ
jgi:hypothetical protein